MAHFDEVPDEVGMEKITDRGDLDAVSSRRAAVAAAMFAVGWPGGVVVLLLAFGGIASNAPPMENLLWMLIVTTVTVMVGYSIGWFAHYWFYETKTPPRRMATVMALIFDGAIFGWVLVLVFRQTAKW